MRTCEEWELASVPFLGWDDDDDHLGMFLAELTKVRVPTGEGDTIRKALEAVSNLSASELPAIPGYADARESWRRLAALHRELFRLSGGKTYFLGCRDAAKAVLHECDLIGSHGECGQHEAEPHDVASAA